MVTEMTENRFISHLHVDFSSFSSSSLFTFICTFSLSFFLINFICFSFIFFVVLGERELTELIATLLQRTMETGTRTVIPTTEFTTDLSFTFAQQSQLQSTSYLSFSFVQESQLQSPHICFVVSVSQINPDYRVHI